MRYIVFVKIIESGFAFLSLIKNNFL